ncbi:MAG TPA: hypothetical protein VLM05_16435 [Mycobacteriales bacterium]|nr:hypothetical protein [Mycobacteriales bacterium]
MPAWTPPSQRWRLLVPAGALVVDADAGPPGRSGADLPPGADVVVVGSRRRVRAHARATGLAVTGEYLALPSLAAPVVLAPVPALAWTSRAVLTVPPGVTRLHLPYAVAIMLARRCPGLLRWVARDRVLIGRRP